MTRTRTRPAAPAPVEAAPIRATGFTIPDGDEAVKEAVKGGSEIAKVIGDATKLYGSHVIRPASTKAAFRHCPTGIFILDMALFGGIPEGLVTQIHGWESGGKTTLAARVAGNMQRKYPDKAVALIDAEGTFDKPWGTRHGVDIDRLVLAQPGSGEQALDIADALLRAKETSLVILDSLPALVPVKEVESSVEDAQVALQARLIGKFLRKAAQALLDERKRGRFPALLLINQFRTKIGVMHGDPNILPGGNALRYIKSVDVRIMNKEVLGRDARDTECVDYNEHTFTIKKNKIGNGIRTGEFKMIRNPDHPRGPGFIDEGRAIITYAQKFGLFGGGGASWRLSDVDQKFGKIDDAIEYIYDHPEYKLGLTRRLITMQREACGLGVADWY